MFYFEVAVLLNRLAEDVLVELKVSLIARLCSLIGDYWGVPAILL